MATAWTAEHLIGGHPALDLANTVFDRLAPAADNELLTSPRDVAGWFRITGLADRGQAAEIIECPSRALLDAVHGVREATFAVFDALAHGDEPPSEPLASVMSAAASGLQDGSVAMHGTRPAAAGGWREPRVVTSLLAVLAIHAYFTLPPDRIRSCPRCGWLFADTSRGGGRRWCSMKTCGNRDKVSRHRGRSEA